MLLSSITATFGMPDSSCKMICVLRATLALNLVGSPSASSNEFVCRDCVPPKTAAIASIVVRIMLLYGSCTSTFKTSNHLQMCSDGPWIKLIIHRTVDFLTAKEFTSAPQFNALNTAATIYSSRVNAGTQKGQWQSWLSNTNRHNPLPHIINVTKFLLVNFLHYQSLHKIFLKLLVSFLQWHLNTKINFGNPKGFGHGRKKRQHW